VHSQLVTPFGEQNVDLVWVHGWRLTEYERQNWAEIMFKRLWHGGYRGRLHAFTWPTLSGDEEPQTNGFLSFDRSEHRAWKSGTPLKAYLLALRDLHSGGRLVLLAHSMGNIVTGEALRLGAPVDLQIMMQAAVSTGCYDTRAVLNEQALLDYEDKKPTPDAELGYRGFLAQIMVPTVNYYNEVDYALQTGKTKIFGVQVSWFAHQGDKPHDPNGLGAYRYFDALAGFYAGRRLLREVTDVHESLAFLARSRTKAVGAQPLTGYTATGNPLGIMSGRLNLNAQPYGFTGASDEHSAQFNRPIQRRLIGFYRTIVDTLVPASSP
jgi:pimeloyl-ACP methyl ester carboxylesterase